MIKVPALLFFGVLLPVFGQGLDLSALDRFAGSATSTTNVTLDRAQLQSALKTMSEKTKDAGQMRNLLSGLNSVAVRTFEFSKPGAYSLADLEPVRVQLKKPGWSRIVEVKEKNEMVEIYMRAGDAKAFAVIAAEPKELTVVSIEGAVDIADLALLPKVTSTVQFHGPEPR